MAQQKTTAGVTLQEEVEAISGATKSQKRHHSMTN
jgi:hypothetical protein